MNHRILRAGTNSASDALIRDMVQSWHNWEHRLQLGIDLHTFCSIASSHPDFADRMRQLIARRNPSDQGDSDAEGVLYGLLWPRQWGGAGKDPSVLPALPYGRLHRPGSDSRTSDGPRPGTH